MSARLLDGLRLAALAALVATAGCGGGSGGGGRVEFTAQGVTLELPPGWTRDPKSAYMMIERAKPEDNHGLVERSALDGKSLDGYVDEMLKTGGQVQSRATMKISGCDAVEVVSHAAYSVAEIYIHKGGDVIRVSFRALPDDFKRQENVFRKSFQSITVK